ncbi:MAG: hypothetical protein ACOCZW_02260, partial [Bacteroidota bacterium]
AYNHFVLKQYGESLYYYKISLDAGYPQYKAYLGIANVYSRSGEPGKAKQFYENAKTLATEEYYYRVINDYAEHFATLGFQQKAISLYKEALSNIKGGHINHCKGLIHMNIAIEYDLKGDTALASKHYQAALELPTSHNITYMKLFNYAEYLYHYGKIRRANDTLNKLIDYLEDTEAALPDLTQMAMLKYEIMVELDSMGSAKAWMAKALDYQRRLGESAALEQAKAALLKYELEKSLLTNDYMKNILILSCMLITMLCVLIAVSYISRVKNIRLRKEAEQRNKELDKIHRIFHGRIKTGLAQIASDNSKDGLNTLLKAMNEAKTRIDNLQNKPDKAYDI